MSANICNADTIFAQAIEIESAGERAAFLEQACGNDAEMRREVEKLVRDHFRAGQFMEQPVAQLVATTDEPITERPGTIIGPYKLLEEIGEGGFAVVFMAEQQQPIRRKVALKVLKPGMDSKQIIARFEAERQALAVMDHPHIAKVLDAGQTASGRPFFVMDLVRGLPITDFCDQSQLTPRERLELFLSVCQAVQHAHQKGIIHRDLKPTNVLVTLQDGAPLVKVIDFGIAKALGQQLTDKTLFTGYAQLVGTPLYMSPEQAALSNVDVDTRSDVYSLGVLLYELLTGTTPFDKERLKEAGYDQMRHIIREEEPPRPSTRISTLGRSGGVAGAESSKPRHAVQDRGFPSFSPGHPDAQHATPPGASETTNLATIAARRKSDPRQLSRSFRGELDWIVMKCLEKDRNRRYETASALAADVQRYLNDEPVLACPPSAWYRLGKFTRRKKTALAVAASVFVALVGVAGGIGWAVRDKTAREEDMQRDRLAREEALDQGVATILRETGPLMDQAKWPEALAVVDRADKLLAAAGRPERPPQLVELQRELTMAQRLEDIYRTPKRNLKANVLIADGQGTVLTSRTQQDSSEEEFFRGREQDAEFTKAFREFGIDIEGLAPPEAAAQIARRSIRSALVKALDDWAPLRKRASGENDPGWKKLIEIARQADPDHWRNRCREALLRGDRQALEQLADAVPIRQVAPATLWQLGYALLQVGARDKAMDLLRRAQHDYPSDLWINDALAWFSWTAYQPPRYDDALRFYTAVLALRPRLPSVHKAVAEVLKAKGALVEAKAEYDQVVAEYSKAVELDPKNAEAWYERGELYRDLHHYEKAITDYSKAIELDPKNMLAWHNRGFAYYDLHQYDKAAADYSKTIELDPNFQMAWHNRGFAYNHLDQHDKAVADFSKAVELDPKDALAWHERGWVYLYKLHQYDKALADLSKAIELGLTGWNEAVGWRNRGNAYEELHQYDKAVADFSKALELDPKPAYAWNNRGWLYYEKLHEYEKAIADYSKAIELDPKMAAAWNGRGCAYCALRQYDKGLADFNKAIELDPKNGLHWGHRGNAYKELHQYDKAVADYSKALELDPKHSCAWGDRGTVYAMLGQWDKAVADYAQLVKLKPDDLGLWCEYASVLVLGHDKEGYRRVCREMWQRWAQDRDPVTLYLAARIVSLAPNDVVEPAEAVERAAKAIAAHPKDAWYHHTLAVAHYRAGQFREAVGQSLESIRCGEGTWGGNVVDYLLLAMAHERLGHAQEARQWLDKALKWIDQTSKGKPKQGLIELPLPSWADRLEVQLLLREAEELLGVKKQKD